jgi:hypothetical protein
MQSGESEEQAEQGELEDGGDHQQHQQQQQQQQQHHQNVYGREATRGPLEEHDIYASETIDEEEGGGISDMMYQGQDVAQNTVLSLQDHNNSPDSKYQYMYDQDINELGPTILQQQEQERILILQRFQDPQNAEQWDPEA